MEDLVTMIDEFWLYRTFTIASYKSKEDNHVLKPQPYEKKLKAFSVEETLQLDAVEPLYKLIRLMFFTIPPQNKLSKQDAFFPSLSPSLWSCS